MKLFPLIIAILSFCQISFAALTSCPPDTTSSILDKTTGMFMLEEAKQYFSEGKLKDAMIRFKSIESKDPESWKPSYWISNCYYKWNNFSEALRYANKSKMKAQELEPELEELLGRSYHQNGKLDSALFYYNSALSHFSKSRAIELNLAHKVDECKFAIQELYSNKKSLRKLLPAAINTEFDEYAPILTKGGNEIYFAARHENTTGGLKNPDDEHFFEDIYRAKWEPTYQTWDSVTNKIDKINTKGFEAITYMDSIGYKALLTVNNTAIEDASHPTAGSDIFEMEYKSGKWSKPKYINNETINTSFFDGSATMSADGNTMVFVSDRNGEKSSTDLYIVKKVGKKWGEAVPLPEYINTNFRETTPSLSTDGKFLFFSSDGLLGMGGYDVYVTEFSNGKWSQPVNLGCQFNTVNDDTHFQLYPGMSKAIMAGVTVDEGQSNYNIYEIEMSNVAIPGVTKK